MVYLVCIVYLADEIESQPVVETIISQADSFLSNYLSE